MPLKVVLISNWFGNPYKELLTASLEKHDVFVEEQLKSTLFLQKVLSSGKPDILHLQTLHYIFASRNRIYFWIKFLLFILQVNILKLMNTATVWTVHEWKDKISGGQHDLSPSKALLLGKTLSGFIVHCDSTKQDIVSDLKLQQAQKVFVVPHGNYIDCYENTVTQTQARRILDIPLEVVSFLFFGGIHPSKGVLDMLDAFVGLSNQEVHLTIAGKSPYPSIKQAIQEKISGREDVLLADPTEGIPDKDIQLYMNACDVVVLPYRIFTTSGVALLAMSFKRACIAPNQQFFKDILDRDGSFLYDTQAECGLQNAMREAVKNQANLSTMGIHNYRLANQYPWELVAIQTKEVYQWSMNQ